MRAAIPSSLLQSQLTLFACLVLAITEIAAASTTLLTTRSGALHCAADSPATPQDQCAFGQDAVDPTDASVTVRHTLRYSTNYANSTQLTPSETTLSALNIVNGNSVEFVRDQASLVLTGTSL